MKDDGIAAPTLESGFSALPPARDTNDQVEDEVVVCIGCLFRCWRW